MHQHRAPAPPHTRTSAPIRFQLPVRLPYDWDGLLAFLAARATPGVEEVRGRRYRRTIQLGGKPGIVEVGFTSTRASLLVRGQGLRAGASRDLANRVGRLFDVATNPELVGRSLGHDPLLATALVGYPGIRVPGAWDGFELAVRAVLGQQVSVRAATTLAGRVAGHFGTPVSGGSALTRLFPTPSQLAEAALERAGVLPSRARTIRRLAEHAAMGTIDFGSGDGPATLAAVRAIPGIGPWTTAYIAMRACGDKDAWLTGDLVLRRAAGGLTTRALDARAECWRPWRAYAVMLLWRGQ